MMKGFRLAPPRLAAWVAIFLCATAAQARAETGGKENAPRVPIPLAVVDFDYNDTSGEARDQKEEHLSRLRDFMQSLRRDLEKDGAFRIVPLDCGAEPCSVMRLTPEDLYEAARKAGARLVLYGGVHKMSTLVEWAQAQIVDVEKNVVVDDRHLSFRGDSDDAWRRAEAFLAKRLSEARPAN
jgi:hypothetical protein